VRGTLARIGHNPPADEDGGVGFRLMFAFLFRGGYCVLRVAGITIGDVLSAWTPLCAFVLAKWRGRSGVALESCGVQADGDLQIENLKKGERGAGESAKNPTPLGSLQQFAVARQSHNTLSSPVVARSAMNNFYGVITATVPAC
jgi:hypothetical protein